MASWERTLGQDGWERTEGTRKLGQDGQVRTAGTGLSDRTVGIVQPGQESQNKQGQDGSDRTNEQTVAEKWQYSKKRTSGYENWDRIAGTGQSVWTGRHDKSTWTGQPEQNRGQDNQDITAMTGQKGQEGWGTRVLEQAARAGQLEAGS